MSHLLCTYSFVKISKRYISLHQETSSSLHWILHVIVDSKTEKASYGGYSTTCVQVVILRIKLHWRLSQGGYVMFTMTECVSMVAHILVAVMYITLNYCGIILWFV